jgi:DHA1 family multidrug resistance protein-like MFS transporter
MAQRLGPAGGPIVGGLIAPLVGLRRSFLITALFYLAAMILMMLFYREPRGKRTAAAPRGLVAVARELAATPGFLLALAAIFTLQTVDRSFGPILPLFVDQLGVPGGRIATISGILFSTIAVCAALGHRTAGRFMARWSPRALVTTISITTAAALIAIVVIPSMWTLTMALIVASVGIGIAMTAAYSVASALIPPDAHVTGFGVMTTASLIGLAFSPVVSGLVGASGLRVVFLVDVVLLLVLAVAVALRMREREVAEVADVPEVP